MSFRRIFIYLLVSYVVAAWVMIEWSSGFGSVLDEWRAEYFDEDGLSTGSMNFRTDNGRLFQSVAMPWGILAYPAAAIAALLLGTRWGSLKLLPWKYTWFFALLMALILARFVWLGVYSAVMSSF